MGNSKSLGSILNEIPAKEQEIDRGKNEAIEFTKRRFRDAKETMEMLKESLLDFSEGINPITVQTMMMLVGDESLQFQFVDAQNKPIENFQFRYDEENKWLITENEGVYLQHLTLGIKDITSEKGKEKEYKTWQMPADGWKSAPLDANQKRYLYAKCSKTGSTGIFETSPTAIAMDTEGEPDYYFLVGVLNSEYEEERSFVTLYGFTEILPGRITTDRVVSGDGESYLDLARNAFRIGDNTSSLDWNVSKDKQLNIKNANFEINNGDKQIVIDPESTIISLNDLKPNSVVLSDWGSFDDIEPRLRFRWREPDSTYYDTIYGRVGLTIKYPKDFSNSRLFEFGFIKEWGGRKGLLLLRENSYFNTRTEMMVDVEEDYLFMVLRTLPVVKDGENPSTLFLPGTVYRDSNNFLKVVP